MPHQTCLTVQVLCVGHASFDLTMTVDHHPGPDEKCSAIGLVKCGGGPAANAAVAVARLGGTSAFAGYLGQDYYGTQHFEELILNGVSTELVVRGLHPTPLSFILVKPDGSRTVINYKMGTQLLKVEQIDLAHCSPKVALFDGHEPLLSLPLANSARNKGVVTVLDAGSVHKGTVALAPLVDYLVASEKYARDFTGEQDMHWALKALQRQAPSVVITCGKKGLVWRNEDGEGTLPAFSVETLDTTGAGDTFHGAFALEIARGAGFHSALLFASAAAALSCKQFGARPSIPSRAEAEDYLRHMQIPTGANQPHHR
jgi:sulfofructose kinase